MSNTPSEQGSNMLDISIDDYLLLPGKQINDLTIQGIIKEQGKLQGLQPGSFWDNWMNLVRALESYFPAASEIEWTGDILRVVIHVLIGLGENKSTGFWKNWLDNSVLGKLKEDKSQWSDALKGIRDAITARFQIEGDESEFSYETAKRDIQRLVLSSGKTVQAQLNDSDVLGNDVWLEIDPVNSVSEKDYFIHSANDINILTQITSKQKDLVDFVKQLMTETEDPRSHGDVLTAINLWKTQSVHPSLTDLEVLFTKDLQGTSEELENISQSITALCTEIAHRQGLLKPQQDQQSKRVILWSHLLQRHKRLCVLPESEKLHSVYSYSLKYIREEYESEQKALDQILRWVFTNQLLRQNLDKLYRQVEKLKVSAAQLAESEANQSRLDGLSRLSDSFSDDIRQYESQLTAILKNTVSSLEKRQEQEGQPTEVGFAKISRILSPLGSPQDLRTRHENRLTQYLSKTEELENDISANMSIQRRNNLSSEVFKEALLNANNQFFPTRFITLYDDSVNYDAVNLSDAETEAINSGIPQFEYDISAKKGRIIVPYKRETEHSGSSHVTPRLAVFTLNFAEDFDIWGNTTQALEACESRYPVIYSLESERGKGLLWNVPVRGLFLITPSEDYTKNKMEFLSRNEDGLEIPTLNLKNLVYFKRVNSLIDEPIGSSGIILIKEPSMHDWEDPHRERFDTYTMLDFETGEIPFRRGVNTDRNTIIIDNTITPPPCETVRYFNAAIKNRGGRCDCFLNDLSEVSLNFLYRTVLGQEIWQRAHGGAIVERSLDRSRFVLEKALNEPEAGWGELVSLSHTSLWSDVQDAVTSANELGNRVEWTSPEGEIYSNQIFADSIAHPRILVFPRPSLLGLKSLHYVDGHWFELDTSTGKLLTDKQFQQETNPLSFVEGGPPPTQYETVSFAEDATWDSYAQAVLTASGQQKEVCWTSPDAVVYSTRKYLSDYSLNQHRLLAPKKDLVEQDPPQSIDVMAVAFSGSSWQEIDRSTGAPAAESRLAHEPTGDYFYLESTNAGGLTDTIDFSSDTAWEHVSKAVLDNRYIIQWHSPDGLVYTNSHHASDSRHKLVCVLDGSIYRVIPVEHIAAQQWNLVNTDDGEIIPGVMVSNDDIGNYTLQYDPELAVTAAINGQEFREHDKNRELYVPRGGWIGALRFSWYDSFSDVVAAVRRQQQSREYVEWTDAKGSSYSSRLYENMQDSKILLDTGREVLPMAQITDGDWVAVETDTFDYTKAIRRNEDGSFDAVYNLEEELGAFAGTVFPAAEEEPSAVDTGLIAKITSERSAYIAGANSQPRKFTYDGRDYIVVNVSGLEPDPLMMPEIYQNPLVLMRVDKVPGGWREHYVAVNKDTAHPQTGDHTGALIRVLERDGIYATPGFWNADVQISDHQSTVITTSGEILSAAFARYDSDGNEVWVETNAEGNSTYIRPKEYSVLRRSPDGKKFVRFKLGLQGGADSDLSTVIVDHSLNESNNAVTDWQQVQERAAIGRRVSWKYPGKDAVYSTDDDPASSHRILHVDSQEASGTDIMPAVRFYGRIWREINPATGEPNGHLLEENPVDSSFRRISDDTAMLQSIWQNSRTDLPPVAPAVDGDALASMGIKNNGPRNIRAEISFMDFVPVASQPGHHDYVAGLLHIRSDLDSNLSIKVTVPVVRYGEDQGLSDSYYFARGFGGRLISIDTLAYVISQLNKSIDIRPVDPHARSEDANKTLREHLQKRYWYDLPVHNALMLLSEAAPFYERSVTGRALPHVLGVDQHAPSLANVSQQVSGWGGFTASMFAVPGFEDSGSKNITANRRQIFLDYSNLENQLLIFYKANARNSGYSPQGEASEFAGGPVLSRLSGVKVPEVVANLNLPGRREFYNSVKNIFSMQRNILLNITAADPISIEVPMQDGSRHLISISDGSLNMQNLSIPDNEYQKLFTLSDAGKEGFSSVQTYNYDGSYSVSTGIKGGIRNPELILDNGDHLMVAPLVWSAPPEHLSGAGAKESLTYLAKKVFLQISLGIGNDDIVGPNIISSVINQALDVTRKVALITLSGMGAEHIMGLIRDENDPEIGAFGQISPRDPNFWGGITGMVIAQNLLTALFDRIRTGAPSQWSSRDHWLTHYMLPATGHTLEQMTRLYTNLIVQHTAGFPRDLSAGSEWVVPVFASVAHGILDMMRAHLPKENGIAFEEGFLQGSQFLIDTIARGFQNASLAEGQNFFPNGNIFTQAILARFLGRVTDKGFLPVIQHLLETKAINVSQDILLDQYRMVYAKERPIASRISNVWASIGRAQHWLGNRIRSLRYSIKNLPVMRIASRINRRWLLSDRFANFWKRFTGTDYSKYPIYKEHTEAGMDMDLHLARRSDVDYEQIFNALQSPEGARVAELQFKPSMSWEKSTAPDFREWILKRPWNPSLFVVQGGPDFVQRLAAAYDGRIKSGRLPEEMGTFSSAFQHKIRKITESMLDSATIEEDLSTFASRNHLSNALYNSIKRSLYEYTVESGAFHSLLRYPETGLPKEIKIVDGVPFYHFLMNRKHNTAADRDEQITPTDVLEANFASSGLRKYPGITSRGVNTIAKYAPDILSNTEGQKELKSSMRSGDVFTNTEMFSTSQSNWMAGSFGSGIDQLQVEHSTRQKMIIYGETSFNATPLTELNQAEAIYVPGALFQVTKVEGLADGNDVGNVVYTRQIDTFDWERNYYYLENGLTDKIVPTPGMRAPQAMDPYTGIVYQIVEEEDEAGVVRYRKVYNSVRNYFLGSYLADKEGEMSRWFRPFDSEDTPKVMHDGIYAAWLNGHEIIHHINQAVDNHHHAYFRNRYRKALTSRDDIMEFENIAKLKEDLIQEHQKEASSARRALNHPEIETQLTNVQLEKLFSWQMANLLRREVRLYELDKMELGHYSTKRNPVFRVTNSFDGVQLSDPSTIASYQAPISIGYTRGENGDTQYFFLSKRESDERHSRIPGNIAEWRQIKEGISDKFAGNGIENFVQACSVAVNPEGYSFGEAADLTVTGMNQKASERYTKLVKRFKDLTAFKYDRYLHALSKIYEALLANPEMDRPPAAKRMQSEELPAYLKESSVAADQLHSAYKNRLKNFQSGDISHDNLYQDDSGRLLLRYTESGKERYVPVRKYPAFDYQSDAPNTIVFQNMDPEGPDGRRFFIWRRAEWPAEQAGHIGGLSANWRSQSYVPADAATLKPLKKDPTGQLRIDDKNNVFLQIDPEVSDYIPVRERLGFNHLKDQSPRHLVFEDLGDDTGKTLYVWKKGFGEGSQNHPAQTWLQLQDTGIRMLADGRTSRFLLEKISDTQWRVWEHSSESGNFLPWSVSDISTENTPYLAGETLIYTQQNVDSEQKSLQEVRIKPLPYSSHKLSDDFMDYGTAAIHDLKVHVRNKSDRWKLFVDNAGEQLEVDSIDNDGLRVKRLSGEHFVLSRISSKNLYTPTNSTSYSIPFSENRMLLDATPDQSAHNRVLAEIDSGKFMYLRKLNYVNTDSYKSFLTIDGNYIVKMSKNKWYFDPVSKPEENDGQYSFKGYWANNNIIVYWDSSQKDWKETRIYEKNGRKFAYINGYKLKPEQERESSELKFSIAGVSIANMDKEGNLFAGNGQRIMPAMPFLNDIPGFSMETFPDSLQDTITRVFQIMDIAPLSGSEMDNLVKTLLAKGFRQTKDLLKVDNVEEFLRTLADSNETIAAILRRTSVILHSEKFFYSQWNYGSDRASSFLHLSIDKKLESLCILHWGENYAITKNEIGSQVSYVPLKLNIEELPKAQAIRRELSYLRTWNKIKLESSEELSSGLWNLHMESFREVQVHPIDGITHATHISNAWTLNEENYGYLFFSLYEEPTKLQCYKYNINLRQGSSNLRCVDLETRLAYFDPAQGWRTSAISSDEGTRSVSIQGKTLILPNSKPGGQVNQLFLEGMLIDGMDAKGSLYHQEMPMEEQSSLKTVFDHYDSNLRDMISSGDFRIGSASGYGNNCLIDSILKALYGEATPYSTEDIEKITQEVREKMVAKLDLWREEDANVPRVAVGDPINIMNTYERTALLEALQNNSRISFEPNTAITVHWRGGGYLVFGDDNAARSIHIWYASYAGPSGAQGHFSPIVRNQSLWGSETLEDANGTFSIIPELDEALGTDTTARELPLAENWQTQPLDTLTDKALAATTAEDSFAWKKQLILQLHGDDTSYKAAENLFEKHPRLSEWMQLKNQGTQLGQTVGWSQADSKVSAISPLQIDAYGRVRIVLVGHKTRQNGITLFGGKTAAQITALLSELFSVANINRIKGIRLDLIGCELLSHLTVLKDSIPGQLAQWLMEQSSQWNILKSEISVSARKYPVRVSDRGKKEILLPSGSWVSKEDARLLDLMHKSDIIWDSQNQEVQFAKPTFSKYEALLEEIETSSRDLPLDAVAERSHIGVLQDFLTSNLHRQIFSKELPDAKHRNSVEENVAAHAQGVDMARDWQQRAAKLQDSESLNFEWKPMIKTKRTESDGTESDGTGTDGTESDGTESDGTGSDGTESGGTGSDTLQTLFVNENTGESRWTRAKDPIFSNFETYTRGLTTGLQKGAVFNSSNKTFRPKSNVSDVDAVHSLNAAFMIKTILDMEHSNTNMADLSTAMKVQMYAQLTQNAIGLADDAAKMVALLRNAAGIEKAAFETLMPALSKIAAGAGILLDGINIVATSIALSQATTLEEKAALGTQLGITTLSAGISIASIAATTAGAVTAGAVLGALAVPAAGLAVGLPPLVEGYIRLSEQFDQISDFFDSLLDSLSTPGLHEENGAWSVSPGLVVTKLDFVTGKMRYGNVTINGTDTGDHSGSAHTVTGGWDHYFAGPEPGRNDRALDIYEGLGLTSKVQNMDTSANVVVLPAGVTTRYHMSYQQELGNRSADCRGFRRMRAHYGLSFVWGYYAFPTDYGIHQLDPRLENTNVTVNLNGANRTLIIPTIQDSLQRRHLSYRICGADAGSYIISLPGEPVGITLVADSKALDSRSDVWLLAIDYAVKNHSTHGNRIQLGRLKKNGIENIHFESGSLRIGGQNVRIQGRPKTLILETDIDTVYGNALMFEADFENYNLQPIMQINNDRKLSSQIRVALSLLERFPELNTAYADKLLLSMDRSLIPSGNIKAVFKMNNSGAKIPSISVDSDATNMLLDFQRNLGRKVTGPDVWQCFQQALSSENYIDIWEYFQQALGLKNDIDVSVAKNMRLTVNADSDQKKSYFMSAYQDLFIANPATWERDDCSYNFVVTEKGISIVATTTSSSSISIANDDIAGSDFSEPPGQLFISAPQNVIRIDLPSDILSLSETVIGISQTSTQNLRINIALESNLLFWSNDGKDLLLEDSVKLHIIRLEGVLSIEDQSRITLSFENDTFHIGEIADKMSMTPLWAKTAPENTVINQSNRDRYSDIVIRNHEKHLIIYPGVQSIADYESLVDDGVFANMDLVRVFIPESVTSIGSRAFAQNQLKTLILSNLVTHIGDWAFSNNNLRGSLTVPESVISIGSHAFAHNHVETLILGNSVTHIGDSAFFDNYIRGNLTLPDSLTSIENYVFQRNLLTTLVIPNSVTSIGAYAFSNNQLSTLNLSENYSLTKIERNAFKNNKLAHLTIPNSVTSIGISAFQSNNLIHLTIPNSVTSIEAYAFSDNQLNTLSLSESYSTVRIEQNAFQNNYLTHLTIPDSVASIGVSAFRNNHLSDITLGNRISEIKEKTFFSNFITNIFIPDNIKNIGRKAFANNHFIKASIKTGTKFQNNSFDSESSITIRQ